MNTKDFVKVLRAVIREEVRAAVRQEIGSLLTESRIKQPRPLQPKPQQSRQPLKPITGNPILDQVLSETKLTPEFRQSTEVAYDDFSFTTNDVPVNKTSIMDMDVSEDTYDNLPEAPSTMPFMKDYSLLLKKADQISAQKQF